MAHIEIDIDARCLGRRGPGPPGEVWGVVEDFQADGPSGNPCLSLGG